MYVVPDKQGNKATPSKYTLGLHLPMSVSAADTQHYTKQTISTPDLMKKMLRDYYVHWVPGISSANQLEANNNETSTADGI